MHSLSSLYDLTSSPFFDYRWRESGHRRLSGHLAPTISAPFTPRGIVLDRQIKRHLFNPIATTVHRKCHLEHIPSGQIPLDKPSISISQLCTHPRGHWLAKFGTYFEQLIDTSASSKESYWRTEKQFGARYHGSSNGIRW